MEFAPGLMLIVQGLSVTMTAPTFDNFRTVLASWILSGDRTARPTIRAAGRLAD